MLKAQQRFDSHVYSFGGRCKKIVLTGRQP